MFRAIEELARGRGFSDRMIQRILRNAHRSAEVSKRRREIHRFSRNGWSMNRGKTMLSEVTMKVGDYLLLKDRYFPDGADPHEQVKLLEELKRRHPEYRSRD